MNSDSKAFFPKHQHRKTGKLNRQKNRTSPSDGNQSNQMAILDKNKLDKHEVKNQIIQKYNLQTFQFLYAACEFEIALKNLNQNNELVQEMLCKIQNMIEHKNFKKEIPSFKNHDTKEAGEGSGQLSSSKVIGMSSESLCPVQSFLESPENKFRDTGSIFGDLSNSKIMATSTQSLCSMKSTTNEYSDSEIFQKFLKNVNCPFCLKIEDDKNSLIVHLDNSCVAYKERKFEQKKRTPYSTFQILPNNTFKCNICPNAVHRDLKHYFLHLQNQYHVVAHRKAVLSKSYTDLLFCASCKVQIPSNATQINLHIGHVAHRIRTEGVPNAHSLLKKGIKCVYMKDKKFKCLGCPPKQSIYQNTKEILQHFESQEHLKLNKLDFLNTGVVYCLYCLSKVAVYSVVAHFSSRSHMDKEEKEGLEETFELCFYCGFKCANLHELASHMESTCGAIEDIRKSNFQKSEKRDQDLSSSEKNKAEESTGKEGKRHIIVQDNSQSPCSSGKNKPEETTAKEGKRHVIVQDNSQSPCSSGKNKPEESTAKEGKRHVIVQGYDNFSELFFYFRKFGDISDMDSNHKKGVFIKFREAIDDTLFSCDELVINGVKVKIIRDDVDDSDKKLEESVKDNSTKQTAKIEALPKTDGHKDNLNSSNFTNRNISPNNNMDDVSIHKLFERSSVHLQNAVFKVDPKELNNVIKDCQNALKLGDFHPVGFSKCELTFLVEDITLFCEVQNDLIQKLTLRPDSLCLTESESFNRHLVRKCKTLMQDAKLFRDVRVKSEATFPKIEFYHENSQNRYKITFQKSDELLTRLLSHCLEENNVVRPFILLIRFWLAVHELKVLEFEYVLISLLVFFLVRESVVSRIDLEKTESHLLLEGLLSNSELSAENSWQKAERPTVKCLFKKFLQFLNTFDFEKNAICLPLRVPVPRQVLLNDPIKHLLSSSVFEQGALSPVRIMDPFLYNNLASEMTKKDLQSLLEIVRDTIEHYGIH